MSKDTFYFSHDYNSRNDVKIKKLLSKHGLLGYGIFWAIIEELYNNANALPTDYDTIAFDLRIEKSVLKSVVNDFDLFTIDDGFFGSFSVQKRIDERNKKSVKARESAHKRWVKNANAMQSQCDPNAIKERKGNKNKGKERVLKTHSEVLEGYFFDLHNGSDIERMAMDLKTPLEAIRTLIGDFRAHCEVSYPTYPKFVFHFKNWARKRLTEKTKDNPLIGTMNAYNQVIERINNGSI